MSYNRSKFIARIPVVHPEYNQLLCELQYAIGGQNWFSGRETPRGYYLSVTPLRVAINGRTTTYTAFSGSRMLLEETQRFNGNHMASLMPSQRVLDNLIEDVTRRNNINYEPKDHPVVG